MSFSPQILFEDNHLFVVAKPAGIATMGESADQPSMVSEIKAFIKERDQKPGNVYLGVVSRLDKRVSGVLLFAKTSKAARRLNEQFRARSTEKTYWSLVERPLQPPEGTLSNLLWHDDAAYRVRVVDSDRRRHLGKEATLLYRTLGSGAKGTSWLEIQLLTGRKHQIRVQLAHAGSPIVGDEKYGAKQPFADGIALHSHRLTMEHPVKKTRMTFQTPPPTSWKRFGNFS
ncbi:Ribosomal large subunit pseudouridine synthase C [Planctomycetales bacterium 10988]|nr:Ribosomal large subunit pseudouridine synthase C [Planctomycetales bacterium 10988]